MSNPHKRLLARIKISTYIYENEKRYLAEISIGDINKSFSDISIKKLFSRMYLEI